MICGCSGACGFLLVGVATKLSFAKLCLAKTPQVLIFDFFFFFFVCTVCTFVGLPDGAYLGGTCSVIYAQEENKHFGIV